MATSCHPQLGSVAAGNNELSDVIRNVKPALVGLLQETVVLLHVMYPSSKMIDDFAVLICDLPCVIWI